MGTADSMLFFSVFQAAPGVKPLVSATKARSCASPVTPWVSVSSTAAKVVVPPGSAGVATGRWASATKPARSAAARSRISAASGAAAGPASAAPVACTSAAAGTPGWPSCPGKASCSDAKPGAAPIAPVPPVGSIAAASRRSIIATG